ncbi:MDR family MFS transporter [Nissabacter sp. SGAir0207]|uniref:MDR family MFS transporter n=1 Tax=Nissabacter sp. SGAir0207 TaxID=2126321 RepID=UPI001F0D9930|nr:MDR family MFS transporter [Nissabacter sp. SGAir0207]
MKQTLPPDRVPHRSLILIACMLAMFMAAIEVTIVATAMPTIIGELGGFPLLGWVFAVYLLTQAVSVPIYGRLADLYGCRRMFFIGTLVFLLGSVLCGFAPSMIWLIVFRALQGLGGGAIMPIASTIIANVYSPVERAKVQGYLSSVWGISAIVGPLMGAFIVEHFNWALVFWINVPIGVVAMAMLARYLPAAQAGRQHSLDLAGTGWLTLAVSALLLALLQAEALGWMAGALLLVAIGSAVMLVRQERRTAEPLFPLALWRSRVIVAGNIGGLVMGAVLMGISAFLPTFVQGVMGGSPLEAGSTLALVSIGWPLASALSGRLMLVTSYRFTALCGALLMIAGSLLLLLVQPEQTLWWARLAAFTLGAGMGLSNTTFLVAVQNAADASIRGIATASTMFSRLIGSALGTALLGATLNLSLQRQLPGVADPVQQLMEGPQRDALGNGQLQGLVEGVATALHGVFMVSAGMALLTLLAVWLMPASQRPAEPEAQGSRP